MGLSDEEKLTVLFLYSDEICRAIAAYRLTVPEIECIKRLIPADEREQIEAENDPDKYAQALYDSALKSPLKGTVHTSVVAFLHAARSPLHAHIIRCDYFELYLRHVPRFVEFIDPPLLVDDLIAKSISIKRCLEPLKEQFENGELTGDRLKKCILRVLPEVGNAAVDHLFMHLIRFGSPECKQYVAEARPNFERTYNWRYSAELAQHGIFTFVPSNTPIAEVLRSMNGDFVVDMYSNRVDNAIPMVKPDERPARLFASNYILRTYQLELVKPAIEKKNCIICSPTGSGKTVVAGYIIAKHLSEKSDSRVCFIVPNITLLEQQKKVCQDFLHPSDNISVIYGDTNAPFVLTILASRVVILTPQMLVNALNENNGKNQEGAQKFQLSMFSLMIFDECHHTTEKHPYNVVMDHYHFSKYTGSQESLPQIVGLTASLGVGGSKDVESAVTHIVKICSNLDAGILSTVQSREAEADLNLFTATSKDEIKMLDNSSSRLLNLHFMMMNSIERTIRAFPDVSMSADLTKLLTFEGEKNKLSSAYLQWISTALKTTIPEFKDLTRKARKKITHHFHHLRILFRKMELFMQFDKDSAVQYYKQDVQRMQIQVPPEIAAEIQIYDNSENNTRSVMLVEMFQLLHQHFTASHQEDDMKRGPRVIIFLKERDYASVMAGLINQDEHLKELGVRADFLISTNSSGDTTLTKQALRGKLRLFEAGDVNVLCVTSVAEEGLDVFKCNLVIKYNYASNDVAHVQRRGRARQLNSRCVLFTQDSSLKEQEERNIAYEKLAKSAVDYIHRQPENWLDDQVTSQTFAANMKRAELRELTDAKKVMLKSSGKVYDLLCKGCDNFISTSEFVRHQNNSMFFVCDPDIWERVLARPVSPNEQMQEDHPQIGLIWCGHCSQGWGRINLAFKRIAIPVIKCKSMVLVDREANTRKAPPKWKSVTENYFVPRQLEPVDAASMSRAALIPRFIVECQKQEHDSN